MAKKTPKNKLKTTSVLHFRFFEGSTPTPDQVQYDCESRISKSVVSEFSQLI